MSEEILLRRGENGDVPFITSSWLKSFRDAPSVAGVPNTAYYYYQHKILEEILPDAEVWVACNVDRHDQALGWICAFPAKEALILHYCYVKQPFRRLGVAEMLFRHLRRRFPGGEVMFTHKSPLFWKRAKNGEESFFKKARKRGFVYNPFLLYTTLPEGWEKNDETEIRTAGLPHERPGNHQGE